MLDLEKLVAIVKEVGLKLKNIDRSDFEVEAKGGHQNFVTEYDKKTQDFLEERLTKEWPDYIFISEEQEVHEQLTDAPSFIIDPIDGTSNFIHAVPFSGISVAVVENKKTVQAIVYNFFLDELFTAERGKGAYLNGERISVSKNDLGNSLFGLGTAPYYDELHAGSISLIEQILPLSTDVRRYGSAALDLCYVAAGRFGGFSELKLQVWDYAAGYLIAEEAGAVVTDLHKNPIQPIDSTTLIAANPTVYAEFFEKIDLDKILTV